MKGEDRRISVLHVFLSLFIVYNTIRMGPNGFGRVLRRMNEAKSVDHVRELVRVFEKVILRGT